MKPDETEFRKKCPQCGERCEDPYCWSCELDLSVRRGSCDEVDTVDFIESGWNRIIGDGFSEPLSYRVFTPETPKADEKPKKENGKETPPRSEPAPSTQSHPRRRPSHLIPFPWEMPISEISERLSGSARDSSETPPTDAALPSSTTPNSQSGELPSEQVPKSDAPADIPRESPPALIHDSAAPLEPIPIRPPTASPMPPQRPVVIPFSVPKTPEIGSSQTQPPLPAKKPQRTFSPFSIDLFKFVLVYALTFLVFYLLIRLFR